MVKASREFQVFAKPAGSMCNLNCRYCYYLKAKNLYSKGECFRMPEVILEEYIVQHIEASSGPVIRFSWHGGEPTVLGLDYFRKIVALQHKHQPPGRNIANGIQTNGTLLDADWARFLADEGFAVGLSLDGPAEMHDRFRVSKRGKPTHARTMRGYELLRQHKVYADILCVVNAHNVRFPDQVYRFFKMIKASYISFLPMVELRSDSPGPISSLTVPAAAWGDFLSTIFDEWMGQDIGRIKVQIFEEAARTAFRQDHSLCIFRPSCGDIPVVEHNGDFYPCDHFVDKNHRLGNIIETPLVKLIESPAQKAFGQAKLDSLPRLCRECVVRDMCHGGCPKNRFLRTPDGEGGLNYLCEGYKRFFVHCRPFISEVAAEWQRRTHEQQTSGNYVPNDQKIPEPGRKKPSSNSGRKK